MRFVSRQLPWLLTGALTSLVLFIAPAGARPLSRPTASNGLGVITAVSQSGSTITTASFFLGTEATGFVLAVPHDATLSSLSPTQIGRDIRLSTINGVKVHYILLDAKPGYLSIALHAPQPDLRLTFKQSLFTFSATESKAIKAGTVRAVRVGIAFSGGPGQLVAAKFKIQV